MCHKSIAIQPSPFIDADGCDISNVTEHAFAITDLYTIDVHGANEYATPDISLKFHVMMKNTGWLHTEISLDSDQAYALGRHLIEASDNHKSKVEQFGRSLSE